MALSQALSEEEFHRMQAQLLELRTQNYQLSDELRKNSAELNSLRQKHVNLEKDYVKAQKAVTKSKKAQEVEALLGENEMLQSKLHSQEEDFRLQNSTLMTELSKLCTQIEQLEQENKALKEGRETSASSSAPSTAPPTVNDELLQLHAENTSLHKKIRALQEQLDKEQLDKDRTAADGETSNTNGVSDVTKEKEPTANHRPEGTCKSSQNFSLSCLKRLQLHRKLELSLNTEKEAQRLLREQLKSVESSKYTETSRLQEEILTDKLKKKQESFQRLQGEKEALYNDSRTKIDEINQRKEEDMKALNSRIQKIQTDFLSANQEHELALHTLRDQAANQSAVSQEQVDHMLQENDALRTSLAALEQIQTAKTQEMNLLREQQEALTNELQQKRVENESLLAQKDDLQSQLQESSFANRKLLEQLTDEGHEKDQLLRELDESKKTAEKRKSMLDDMAMQLNQEKSDHKEALSDLKLQHEKEVLAVRARYEKELRGLHEDKNRSEEEIRQQLREEKVQAMEGTKGWFERRLKEAEENLEKKILEHHEQIEKLQKDHSDQIQVKHLELEQVQQQLVEMEKQKEELNQTIDKLKQEIKDTVDGQRILEKKGSAALKDLKRQLQLERKRADKLQERLQDILTKTRTAGLEELNLSEIHSPSRTQQAGDSSSVSSFSFKDMMKEQPANQNKVKHLEVSCSSMAEDICKKSAIIETYVMDSRRDVSGSGAGGAHSAPHTDRGKLGAVLRDLVKPGDDNLREMNKKLQNMLEEQLTKNMHLQKDLEVLSQELVRVSKDGSSSTSG
ncbi:hypothetical protein WMY93_027681 [Mugilogobius chulae]|uniref:GRIP1-associated protein 1 n=1 Tax=Mugilogobius chulae TaxID=88201 RepID=A0AAW0MTM5_9GOBI